MGNSIVFKSLRDLNKQIMTKKLSVTELIETFLQRLELYAPSLNAVVSITRDRAMKHAEYIEQEIEDGVYRGPLQGIPFGVKDWLLPQVL